MEEERDGRGWMDYLLWAMLTAAVAMVAYQRGEVAGLRSAPEQVAYQKEADKLFERLIEERCE